MRPMKSDQPPRSAPSGEIQVRVPDIGELFNPMDPSPLRQKDLDPDVEEFIVSWGRELPRTIPLSLIVRVEQDAAEAEAAEAAGAVRAFFAQHTVVNERRLRQLFRIGRTSLAIGIGFLAISTAVGQFLVSTGSGSALTEGLGGALEIGGWVAMWRPLSIFLYDWWPLAADIRLFRRLAEMPVKFVTEAAT
jgi:hypothetical protein